METPDAMFRSALQMLPRLEAEESILAVHRAAVAAGTIESSARERITARWERRALARATDTAAVPCQAPRALPHLGLGLQLTPAHGD